MRSGEAGEGTGCMCLRKEEVGLGAKKPHRLACHSVSGSYHVARAHKKRGREEEQQGGGEAERKRAGRDERKKGREVCVVEESEIRREGRKTEEEERCVWERDGDENEVKVGKKSRKRSVKCVGFVWWWWWP